MTQLYIPKKIKIGFNNRADTFTGKLAFITYYDDKNVLRQEKSWDGWRNKSIAPLEFDNIPRSNFVFNKGVQRYADWGSGRSVIRVHDSRDFEFEITVDNLIGILMHSDVSKRDIVEECVYAWSGKQLVLLPVNSEEYKAAVSFTKKQALSISTKDLKVGMKYTQKKSDLLFTYIGYYEWYEWRDNSYSRQNTEHSTEHVKKGKKHIFYNGSEFVVPNIETFSDVDSEDENFANLAVKFSKSIHAKPFVKLTFSNKFLKNDLLYSKLENDILWSVYIYNGSMNVYKSHVSFSKSIKMTKIFETHSYYRPKTDNEKIIGEREFFKNKVKTDENIKEFLKMKGFSILFLEREDGVTVKYKMY